MSFKDYLTEQIKKHPSMQAQDVIKLCYQAAFGAEHLLSDISAARRYFDAEFESVEARDGELVEMISDDVCRVDLAVWKKRGLPPEKLFDAFAASANVSTSGGEDILVYLDVATGLVRGGECNFSFDEWESLLEKYSAAGMPAVHHSAKYREKEKPSYRIVKRSLLDI